MVKLWTGKDRSSRSSPTVPQTQKGLQHIMEEFRRETYTADQVGLDTQTTVYIVERCFGDYDLIDLYSDYVAERVKADLRKRNNPSRERIYGEKEE